MMTVIAVAVAGACVAITVAFRLWEPDMWQHLAVGKAIWTLREIPTTHQWSWPTYGARDVNASWGFRALVWPFWDLGGVWGLYAWRWMTTLVAFGLLWAASRRLAARGLAPLFILVVAALTWRYRASVRPETLVAVLLALQIWILETRRRGGPDRSLWLIPLAWMWANVHISYHLGLAMLGVHALNDFVTGQGGNVDKRSWRAAKRMTLIVLAALAISFVNPWGWRALWQPFEYFLYWRHELIYQTITELQPLHAVWRSKVPTGLPLLLIAWPVLLAWRARRRGLDLVELVLCLLYSVLAISTVRFAGFYALVAAPYLGRDLDEWIRSRHWLGKLSPPAVRLSVLAVLCVLVCLPEWRRADMPLGVGINEKLYPRYACDFMVAHDIRGRGFNQYHLGGYLVWRFWPERDRLPFMDIHQSGTRDDQRRYSAVFTRATGWQQADAHYHFDNALLDAAQDPRFADRARDQLDADDRFALVFRDDAAALYVRRDGRYRTLADSLGCDQIPGSDRALPTLAQRWSQDPVARARARDELERMAMASPWNSWALSLLANIDLVDHRYDEARTHLEQALAVNPDLDFGHERLGIIALSQGRASDAVRELERARQSSRVTPRIDARLGQAYEATGDIEKARECYQRALAQSPHDDTLRAALQRLEDKKSRNR